MENLKKVFENYKAFKLYPIIITTNVTQHKNDKLLLQRSNAYLQHPSRFLLENFLSLSFHIVPNVHCEKTFIMFCYGITGDVGDVLVRAGGDLPTKALRIF